MMIGDYGTDGSGWIQNNFFIEWRQTMNNWLYAVKDKENLCKKRDYHLITMDGKSLYTGETMSGYIEQGYEILNADEFNALWNERWADYENGLCGKWKEISAERYDDMLNCLPPLEWTNGGFFISELYDGNIGYFFQEWYGRYYESMQNILKPRDNILSELRADIKNGSIKPLENAE
jgi:hypothetical protein